MGKLKGVILSVEDILVPSGKVNPETFSDVSKLIEYLKQKGIEFVVWTNRKWTYGEKRIPLEQELFKHWGEFPYFCREDNYAIPPKPRAEATQYILNQMNWEKNETVYIGASESDMQTAVNGGLLFLKGTWWANKTGYGFEFSSPKDIACFIDTLCLRDHLWCHQIREDSFEFYALAPFSTMKPEHTLYSTDARAAAKNGTGNPDFWIGALTTSLYFSGIHERLSYIAVYPGHQAGSGNLVMDKPMSIFGKCFRVNYIPDLIIRHTTALKSQNARNAGQAISHINQLNSIHLNPTPSKTSTSKYVRSPLTRGKTVLLVDDICTNGYSLESARTFIEQTGANVIMVSWLKTINTDIHQLNEFNKFDPYMANKFLAAPVRRLHTYRDNIVDHEAPVELTLAFSSYTNWQWPNK